MVEGRLGFVCGWWESFLNGRPFKVELFVVSLWGRPTLVELVADEVLNLACFLMYALLCLCLYRWPRIEFAFMHVICTVLTKSGAAPMLLQLQWTKGGVVPRVLTRVAKTENAGKNWQYSSGANPVSADVFIDCYHLSGDQWGSLY